MLADRCPLLEGRAGDHWEEAGQGDPCPREPWSPSSQAAGSTPEAPSADLAPQGWGTNPELSRRHSTQPTAHTSSHAHTSRHRRQTRRSRENTPPSHGQTHIQTITWAGATGHRQETEVRLKAPKTPEPGSALLPSARANHHQAACPCSGQCASPQATQASPLYGAEGWRPRPDMGSPLLKSKAELSRVCSSDPEALPKDWPPPLGPPRLLPSASEAMP